jgi:succinoglycan biosynthesis transport protein ExoP
MAAESNGGFYLKPGMQNSSDDQEEGLDVWGFLKRRKGIVISLALLGAGLSYLLFERQVPNYRAFSQVQVIHPNSNSRFSGLVNERDLSDAPFVIVSPSLLHPAVQNHNLTQLALFRGMTAEEIVATLPEMLTVSNPADSNVVEISVDGSDPEDVRDAANAIAAEYVNKQTENYTDARSKIADALKSVREEIHDELQKKEKEYKEFRENSRLTSDGSNPHRTRHRSLMDEISRLKIELTQIQSHLKSHDEAVASGVSRDVLMMLARKHSGVVEKEKLEDRSDEERSRIREAELQKAREEYERAVAEAERAKQEAKIQAAVEKQNAEIARQAYVTEKLFPLQVEMDLLTAQYGKDHPKVTQHAKKMDLTRENAEQYAMLISQKKTVIKPVLEHLPPKPVLEDLKSEAPEQETSEVTEQKPEVDFLAVYRDSLSQELTRIESNLRELDVEATKEETLARELMQDEILDRNKTQEMERLSRLFDEYITQIRETKVNVDMGGIKAQILTPAMRGFLVYPKLSQFLGLGAFLGAFVGMAIGYLVEISDKTFRKPEDILREFGIPIIGHIPLAKSGEVAERKSAESQFDEMAVAVHSPRSRIAEAFRSVRTAVCFSALGGAHRVIQVTSPTAGDGKSTLALNLAVTMAMSGKKTILIDCDMRRPRVHRLTGAANESGVSDVLQGAAELTDCVQSTEVENFFVLPCGTLPKNPGELLMRAEFGQLLHVLREKFEYVIVDTPPVMAVSDPCAVAAQVDGVLLATRLGRHTRELGRRTLEQLRDVGAVISGLVINGVSEGDYYGYGNYRYTNYRGYSYSYGYGSDSRKSLTGAEGYYADPEELEAAADSGTAASATKKVKARSASNHSGGA